ncbi:BatD family protein [Kangiella sediminilitoris]|nr:BatD family protein [Kangiella sediminilitoris]
MTAKSLWLQSIIKLSALLLLSTIASVSSAEITMSLDRTDIHEHETFRLRVQVEETDTLRQGASRNFIPEEITVRSRQEYNNSVIINGQYNIQRGWDFELLAQKAGTYTIPALTIGNERSKPFVIRVLPEQDDLSTTQASKVKLRSNVSDDEIYVQQQLIFTVRIYRSVIARNEKLPPVRVSNALVEQLGDTSSFEVVKADQSYRVVERRYAIFPQQSGEMVIEPITYSARVPEDSERRSPWQRSQLQPISLSTQKYTIKVKPKPSNAAEPWLPAKKLKLTANWKPANQNFRVGEPANLDLIISATGLLKTQLPAINFPDQGSLTIYRDSPQYHQRFNRFGVNSYHFEKVTVIPSQTGEVEIPEIKVPWWNVKTDKQEYAVLPAIRFNVNPSNKQILQNQQQMVIPESQQPSSQDNTSQSEGLKLQPEESSGSTVWKYISLTFAVLWIFTLLFWLLQRRKDHKNHIHELPQQIETSSLNLGAAIKAAKSNVAHKTFKALQHWLFSQKEELKDISSLNGLIQYCRQNQLQQLGSELENLQESLYSNMEDSPSWDGQELAQLLPEITKIAQPIHNKKLPELYP